ncbi:hypothetical protein BJ322DRAFT_844428 [Thelephora terrestris]|uniref:Uncharacterized protein n=1 Tax=Thelephora terrestris TaxID=56493 RepID=A0A9P6HCW4_9AGAM|nr:hypothetical protein BJ322DRAFT_844428 [Thelephora terrestris]
MNRQLNNGDPDALYRALGDHMNSLLLPQDKAPPSPINGVCVPQRKYDKGTGRDDPKNQGRVVFIREDGTYLPVKEALEKIYGTLMDQNLLVLDKAGLSVMVRFEVNKHTILGDTDVHLVAQWPGYRSKEYQMRFVDWRGEPQKVPLHKLATDIAKIINKFVGDMQGKPIQPNYAMWRVGQDAIRPEDLRLAALEQVSAGSWQPRLFYMRSH